MISGEQNSKWGFFAVLAAAFLWGTTGTAATFAPSLNPLAIGAVAMGGGGLLQALLARSSIVQYWQHIVCHKALLAVGVVSVAIYDHVEALEYAEAHWLAGGMLAFSFVVLLVLYGRRRGSAGGGVG